MVIIYLTIILIYYGLNEKILSFLNPSLYISHTLGHVDKTLMILITFLMGTYFSGYFINLFLKPNISNFDTIDKSTTIFLKQPFHSGVIESESTMETKIVSQKGNGSSLSFGMSIGLIERTLIILLVSTSNFTLVAIIVGLKTLTRFKMIEQNRDFGEYYLVGNLLSLTFSITAGLLIKLILS